MPPHPQGKDCSPTGREPLTHRERTAHPQGKNRSPSGRGQLTPRERTAHPQGEDRSPSGREPLTLRERTAYPQGEDCSPSGGELLTLGATGSADLRIGTLKPREAPLPNKGGKWRYCALRDDADWGHRRSQWAARANRGTAVPAVGPRASCPPGAQPSRLCGLRRSSPPGLRGMKLRQELPRPALRAHAA